MIFQDVLIRKNNNFILVEYFLNGLVSILDPMQEVDFLSLGVSNEELGREIRVKLSKSRMIDFDEVNQLLSSNKINIFTSSWEKKIKDTFSYKTKKEIYKDMDFLSVRIKNNVLTIIPWHQDSLDGYTAIEDENRNWIKFDYPIDLSYEELGEAVMRAFEYCTSIYKKK